MSGMYEIDIYDVLDRKPVVVPGLRKGATQAEIDLAMDAMGPVLEDRFRRYVQSVYVLDAIMTGKATLPSSSLVF